MNRWHTTMLTVGIVFFLLWASVCFQFTDRVLGDEDSGGRLKPMQWYIFAPLLTHIFYIIAPLARLRFNMAFLVGTPLHIPMLGFLLLAVRYSLWPLLLLIATACWIFYVTALFKSERRHAAPAS